MKKIGIDLGSKKYDQKISQQRRRRDWKVRCSLRLAYVAIILFPLSASALLMRDNGPEPIIIQLKQSLLESETLDTELAALALLETEEGMTVEKRWAGVKYLELLSFPPSFTEEQALAVIDKFQQTASIEKVVAVSAFNLEFTPGDFGQEFGPTELIPDAVRRALDNASVTPSSLTPAIEQVAMPHVPGELIVKWKDEYVWNAQQTGFAAKMAAFNALAGATVLYDLYSSSRELTQVLAFDEIVTSLADQLDRYNASGWVAYAQPDFIYGSNALVPNDPGFTNPGQPNLLRISAPYPLGVPNGAGAWNITTGSQNYVVAVADSGANVSHPDFAPNLAPGSHNFITGTSDVTDDNGHGSNVAAIIGAQGNNNQYMTGLAWDVGLLHLKVADAQGGITTAHAVSAIDYAYAPGHNAIAINLSFGSVTPSSSLDLAERDAIRRARANNMAVVASAGNNGIDEEQPGKLISPADIPTDNLIAVGATAQNDTRAIFSTTPPQSSNFGRYRVELGAPGVDILGLTQQLGFYSIARGTSQAAPHVTGALELVKSKYPWEHYAGLKDRVLMGTDDIASLNNVFRTGGRLNLLKALHARTLMRNLSTRGKVESGDRIVIGGFIIGGSGTGSLKVALRGLGPSLPALGVPRLNNPKIQLNNSAGQKIFANDDYGNLPQLQKNDLAAAGLTPTDSREAAMVETLAPGAYTLFLQSQDGQQGVGLFEIYELAGGTNEQTRLLNISTRCPVGVGDGVAIAGTIIGANPSNPNDNTVPKRRVLMFGKGPSLASLGVPGVLANPKIDLHNSAGAVISSNDQWKDIDGTNSTGLEDKLNEPVPGFAPKCAQCNNESALWPTLPQSNYTTILSGVSNGTGIGLVEFYEY